MNPDGMGGGELRAAAGRVQTKVSDKLGDVWWFFLLRGLVAVALGLCALFWPSSSLGVLLRLVGVYCLVDGIIGLVGALRGAERSSVLPAVIGLAIGVVLLAWPSATSRTLMMLFGVWALIVGVGQIMAARRATSDESLVEVRRTVGIIAVILGIVLLVWPGAGVVTVAWLIGIVALLVGALLIFLATRVKRLRGRVDGLAAGRGEASS
jgi:uncharacterized membrane protein HdeD (DUF308 family)